VTRVRRPALVMPGAAGTMREGGLTRAPACRTAVFSAGTRVRHSGRLVVIVPEGRHSSTPIRRSLPWLGSLGGISYLFDPTSSVASLPCSWPTSTRAHDRRWSGRRDSDSRHPAWKECARSRIQIGSVAALERLISGSNARPSSDAPSAAWSCKRVAHVAGPLTSHPRPQRRSLARLGSPCSQAATSRNQAVFLRNATPSVLHQRHLGRVL
jgi:hypothetical protein